MFSTYVSYLSLRETACRNGSGTLLSIGLITCAQGINYAKKNKHKQTKKREGEREREREREREID